MSKKEIIAWFLLIWLVVASFNPAGNITALDSPVGRPTATNRPSKPAPEEREEYLNSYYIPLLLKDDNSH